MSLLQNLGTAFESACHRANVRLGILCCQRSVTRFCSFRQKVNILLLSLPTSNIGENLYQLLYNKVYLVFQTSKLYIQFIQCKRYFLCLYYSIPCYMESWEIVGSYIVYIYYYLHIVLVVLLRLFSCFSITSSLV